jgi:Flp pilus assembly protein TadD
MHGDARLNMATAFARQGRMDQASRELTRLVEQDPDNAVARTNLGVVLIQQGKIEQARTQLEAALRADPTLGPARQALESIGR